jgi:uncharacterized membrane protein YbhN (UPF0104 family)
VPEPARDVEVAPPRLGRLTRGLTLSIAAGATLYVGFGAWSGFREIGERLASFPAWRFLVGLLLASLNYLCRFAKWEVYLRRLAVRVPKLRSLAIFLAGFSLTVTPGKVGEVLKSYLLREDCGVPMARTAPIVLAERVTDLVGCLLLVLVGAATFGRSREVVFVCAAGAILVGALVLPVLVPPLGDWLIGVVERLPAIGRAGPKLRQFHEATRVVLAPAPFALTLALSVIAWAAECTAFWVIAGGFAVGGEGPSLLLCTFIYALTTVGGALSFLPGGLGVQEGGMVGLLLAAGAHLDRPAASAATILTRLATLWYAVLLGVIALVVAQRSLGARPSTRARA